MISSLLKIARIGIPIALILFLKMVQPSPDVFRPMYSLFGMKYYYEKYL